MKPCLFFVLILAAGPGARATAAARPELLETLVRNSPFGAGGARPGPAAAAAPLEFRGFFVERGERYFSVYDSASRRGYWLRENERAGALAIRHFDSAAPALAVEYDGLPLTLQLKPAVIRSAPAPTVAAAVSAPAGAPAREAPAAAGGTPEIDALSARLALAQQRAAYEVRQRLAAEEMRRKRAARPAAEH